MMKNILVECDKLCNHQLWCNVNYLGLKPQILQPCHGVQTPREMHSKVMGLPAVLWDSERWRVSV